MAEYLDKIHALLHDFNELLPTASTPSQELEQKSKLFMLVVLHVHVRDQILRSPTVPNFTSACSTFFCVPCKHTTDVPVNPINDSSALVFQVMIALTLTSRAKGVTSVTIVANLTTTGVMFYMVTLLNLHHLPKLLLLCNLILWILFYLIL